MNAEAEGKPDVITAPSPLLTVTDPGYMTDIWYEVVKTTAVYAATNLDKPSTISINVHKNIFGDRRYELEDVVYKSAESLSNPQILVMKLYDCKDIILNAETRSRMRNLEGKRLDQVYVDLRANKIWLVDERVMVGKPIIKGTRVTVEAVVRRLAEGYTTKKLIAEYPNLKKEDIMAAMTYAARLVDDEIGKKIA